MEAQLKEWSAQLNLMEARIVNSGAAMPVNPGAGGHVGVLNLVLELKLNEQEKKDLVAFLRVL